MTWDRARRFRDRKDGGEQLGNKLARYAKTKDAIVLGLPRGGVVTAREVASRLGLPLDVIVVRKLGTPGQPELAMGAIARGGIRVLNDDVIRSLRIANHEIEAASAAEERECARREMVFRGGRPPRSLDGKTVILVDDGLATGSTMFAAVEAVRAASAARIVVAVPVAPPQTIHQLAKKVDEIVCLETPVDFMAVGEWYDDFTQLTDREVIDVLAAEPPVGAAR